MITLCKETDGGLTGTFTFTSPAWAGPVAIPVVAGATQPVCTAHIQVTAGRIAATEGAAAGTRLVSARAAGPGALINLNLLARVVTFTVPAGPPAAQTLGIFRNAAGD